MDFSWEQEYTDFREQVRDLVRRHAPNVGEMQPGELEESDEGPDAGLRARRKAAIQAAVDEMEAKGWLKAAWPAEYGGGGKSPWYQYIMSEELSYGGIPFGGLSIGSIAPAIVNHGSEEQKKRYLPGVLKGEITFALGYSEPNAGTDLASLETAAARDGDDWVVNGQKLWTSGAHNSTHLWLAARTDPKAPKHRGISMLILPLDAAGITVRPIYTMSGTRTNEVFFENVRVPGDSLVGEENRGWYATANALDHERVSLAPLGGLVRGWERMMNYLKSSRPDLLKDRQVRLRLAEAKMDIEVQRALKTKNASIIANHQTPTMEASMVKVFSSERGFRYPSLMMDLLGRAGALTRHSEEEAPLKGQLAGGYLGSPILRFGGGTNEVQRNIISQRGLGLPR